MLGAKLRKEKIIQELEARGYFLIDSYYRGIREKHMLTDKDGYIYYSKLDNLINSNRVPEKYSPANPYTLINMQHYLDKIGSNTKILSDTYKNSHSKLKFLCGKCGREYKVSPNHLISRGSVICP